MAKMKTEFDFISKSERHEGSVKIVDYKSVTPFFAHKEPRGYIIIDTYQPDPYKQGPQFELRGKDLELLAVNILKALKSKKLKK